MGVILCLRILTLSEQQNVQGKLINGKLFPDFYELVLFYSFVYSLDQFAD